MPETIGIQSGIGIFQMNSMRSLWGGKEISGRI
jgi:hypothetical protein